LSNDAIQNSADAFVIFADDETAIGTGKTGLTITATLCKNGAGSFFNGLIDDVRLFGIEPSQATITAAATVRAYQPSVGGGFSLSRVLN